jgi:hypothetical protein
LRGLLRGLLRCLLRCLLRGLWRYRATTVVALGLPMNGVMPAKTWLAVDIILLEDEFLAVSDPFGNYRKNLCKINFLGYFTVLVDTLIKDKRAFPIDSDASPGMNAYILVAFLNFRHSRIFLNTLLSMTLSSLSYNAQFPRRAEVKVYFIGKPDLIPISRIRLYSAMILREIYSFDTRAVSQPRFLARHVFSYLRAVIAR